MRNIILKSLLTIFVIFISGTAAFGQKGKQEVSVHIAGGVSTLSYETEIGKRNNGAGGNFGVGYTYFFSEKFGLNTGVEFSLYKAEIKRDQFNNVTRSMVDPSDNELYDFYSLNKNYKEKQDASYINIPVMLQFQHGEKNKIYARAGAKLGIPVKGKYKSSASEIVNKGFFHDTSNWGETQEFIGFGTYTNYSNDEDLDLNIACIISAEVGMKWKLTDKMSLYTGAYIDYGVNDIIKGNRDNSFTKFEETSEGISVKNNSFLNSYIGYENSPLTQELTDKVLPLSAGIKISLAFEL